MPIDDDFDQALRSAEPLQRLRSLALALAEQGWEKTAIVEKFETARRRLREADEEAVMDVMDFLDGWCSPHKRLPLEP
jgi:hypothetical protein